MSRRLAPEALHNLRASRERTRQRYLEECRVVCNQPFRERYLQLKAEGRLSPSVFALELGWRREKPNGTPVGDIARLHRALGLLSYGVDRRMVGAPKVPTTIRYEVAVKMADMLGMDAHEAGL